jgi:hypothetical protein
VDYQEYQRQLTFNMLGKQMNKDTATQIVKQYYTKASDPSLSNLLETFSVLDSGVRFYRPYIVAALMMQAEQKTLIKADVATWELNEKAYDNLMNLQFISDQISQLNIPESISVPGIVNNNTDDNLIGITLI